MDPPPSSKTVDLSNAGNVTVKRRFSQLLIGDVVTFEVGQEEKKQIFIIHKNLLSTKVPVFDKMFNGPFQEASDASASLPDDDPEDFEAFVEWLYRGTIPATPPILDQGLRSYPSATKYLIEEMADRFLTIFIDFLGKTDLFPPPRTMQAYYASSSPGSKLQLFLKRAAAYTLLTWEQDPQKPVWYTEEFKKVFMQDLDFMNDVVELVRGQSGQKISDPRRAAKCEYHQHPKSKACPYDSR